MNNTTPIKILTAAVLLTFGFALTANAALINKGVTEMNHELLSISRVGVMPDVPL